MALQIVWDRIEAENFVGFSAEERTVLLGFLRRIRENLMNGICQHPIFSTK